MSLTSGDTFAGYEVQRRLGAGGMGEVYLVRHPRLPRLYALKTLSASLTDDVDFRARFSREAELAAELSHPHIVGVHDRGEYEGRLWIAMDYIEGIDAAQLLREQYPSGLPEQQVVEIVTAVADALDYAHDRRLLHRDVKPANILLDDTNPTRRRILLADFGVARRTDDTSGITATNTTIGSVAYAAPEQLMGRQLDARADQYALAATTFQLLTGNPPFQNSNPAVVISGHLNVPPPPLAQTRPDLAHLDPALSKGLAKDPNARYARCRDFAEALASLAGAGPGASVPPPPPTSSATQPYPPTPPPFPSAPPAYQASSTGFESQPTPYWEQSAQPWEQPVSQGNTSLKPAILIPVAILLLVLVGAGSYGVVRLLSSDSAPATSARSSTQATPSPSDPEPTSQRVPTTGTTTPTTTPTTAAPNTPTPATPTPISVSGIGQDRTLACDAGGTIEVSGIENKVTITGHCAKVTISGQQNTVIIDSTDAIDASGIDNVVTYHSGNPTIDHSGIDVTVQQG
jgi:serine/threonine protein kinase, bacterial